MELLEGLDVDEDSGAFVRTGDIVVHIGGKPRQVKITTDGWEEALARWKAENPKPLPHFREVVVRQGDDIAKLLGLKKFPAVIRDYDMEEPGYRAKLEEWNEGTFYATTAAALKIPLRSSGVELSGISDRVAALKKMGMTAAQAQQIGLKVINLSLVHDAEDAESFGEPSAPGGS